jgi:hypothetical protein
MLRMVPLPVPGRISTPPPVTANRRIVLMLIARTALGTLYLNPR